MHVLSEKKRKLFVDEVANSRPLDWEKLKKRKKSMFQPVSVTFQPEDQEVVNLFEVYNLTRTEDDEKVSDDIVCVLLPGQAPNVPSNKNAETYCKAMRSMVPKHQPPKLGQVEMEQTDILRRVRAKGAFMGAGDGAIPTFSYIYNCTGASHIFEHLSCCCCCCCCRCLG